MRVGNIIEAIAKAAQLPQQEAVSFLIKWYRAAGCNELCGRPLGEPPRLSRTSVELCGQ